MRHFQNSHNQLLSSKVACNWSNTQDLRLGLVFGSTIFETEESKTFLIASRCPLFIKHGPIIMIGHVMMQEFLMIQSVVDGIGLDQSRAEMVYSHRVLFGERQNGSFQEA